MFSSVNFPSELLLAIPGMILLASVIIYLKFYGELRRFIFEITSSLLKFRNELVNNYFSKKRCNAKFLSISREIYRLTKILLKKNYYASDKAFVEKKETFYNCIKKITAEYGHFPVCIPSRSEIVRCPLLESMEFGDISRKECFRSVKEALGVILSKILYPDINKDFLVSLVCPAFYKNDTGNLVGVEFLTVHVK